MVLRKPLTLHLWPSGRHACVCVGTAALAASFFGCGGSSTAPTTPTAPTAPTAPTVTSVTISGNESTAAVGQTVALVATAIFSDGTTSNVTTQAAWESSNVAVATVSPTGSVNFVGAGEVDLRATLSGVSGSTHVSVTVVAVRHNLVGTILDADNNQPLAGVLVQVLDGPNAGRSTQTGGTGSYSLTGLVEGSFTVQFSRTSYTTATRGVTLSADTRVDLSLSPETLNVARFYGTFAVTVTMTAMTCEFPVIPRQAGTLVLSGRSDGSGFTARMTEGDYSRTYTRGYMNANGTFTGFFDGLLPVRSDSTDQSGPQHEAGGDIRGTVSGVAVTGTETLTFKYPCAGKIINLSFSGRK